VSKTSATRCAHATCLHSVKQGLLIAIVEQSFLCLLVKCDQVTRTTLHSYAVELQQHKLAQQPADESMQNMLSLLPQKAFLLVVHTSWTPETSTYGCRLGEGSLRNTKILNIFSLWHGEDIILPGQSSMPLLSDLHLSAVV